MNGRIKCFAVIIALSVAGESPPLEFRLLASPVALQQSSVGPQGQKDFEQRALEADRAFTDAAAKSDTAALDKMLDVRFMWTDASGKTLTRKEFLQQAPKPAISDAGVPGAGGSQPLGESGPQPGSGPMVVSHNYGSLEIIQIHSGKDHALHIWVNRSAGWRLLVYQEVRLLDEAPTPTPGRRAACDNPCKTLPYDAKTQNERDVLTGFMSLQTYTVAHDSVNWGKYVADEFEAANSNSNQTLTKRNRMEDLRRNQMAGYTPMPVVEMRVLDFGTAAILISKHQPEHANAVHITRVWIKRGGNWMEAASYQTRIEGAAAP
jgi:hypothetical protein